MMTYDRAKKVLDAEQFPQHNIAGLISGITFIVLFCFSQEKPLRWKKIHTQTDTHTHTYTHTQTQTQTQTHKHQRNQ